MESPLPIVYIAAHGGYHPEHHPLGGGAAVCRRLVQLWGADPRISLTLLAPAEKPPDFPPTVGYVRLPVLKGNLHPAQLTQREYAAFCRGFEAAATKCLERLAKESPSRRFAVLSNDIAEGIDFRRASALGLPVVTLFHVDVADIFSRLYLGCKGPPVPAVRLFSSLEALGLCGLCPDVLRLVFEKQAQCVRHSARLAVPSGEMARTLARCYGEGARRKTAVLPWGGWEEAVSEQEVEAEVAKARREFDLGPETTVLLTLSRISPEKGTDFLLKALLSWERQAAPSSRESRPETRLEDLRVLICGSAAFMGGEAFARKLQRLASKLRRIRVSFPGHVGGPRKRALFRLADLYVFPSRHESYGLTLVEALRQGVPALTSACHGARHLVRPAYGRVVNLDRCGPRRLLDALQTLLADRERLASMKEEARRAGREMDFSRAASNLRDLIAATLA